MRPSVFFCLLFLMPAAENVLADHIRSPEVHPDRTVTFRLRSETAQKIVVSVFGQDVPLKKGSGNVWSGRSPQLKPGIHDYSFRVDGTRMIDPANRRVKKWFSLASMVEIPGEPSALTEFADVPHGVLQRMIYRSASVGDTQRPVVVYTPPGYAADSSDVWPLIVLLHGFGDDERAWTEVGRAHLVADNLIAKKLIRPCIIAMPLGHPIPAPYEQRPKNYFEDNADLYERDLTADLLPFLESHFRVARRPEERSVVGLSMGGGQAIDTGLKNTETFGAIGAFSAAAPQLTPSELLKKYPAIAGESPAANGLRHFWIPIGDTDFLLERNDKFVQQLQDAGVHHVYVKSSGGHEWRLWRDYLGQFLQLAVPPSPVSGQ